MESPKGDDQKIVDMALGRNDSLLRLADDIYGDHESPQSGGRLGKVVAGGAASAGMAFVLLQSPAAAETPPTEDQTVEAQATASRADRLQTETSTNDRQTDSQEAPSETQQAVPQTPTPSPVRLDNESASIVRTVETVQEAVTFYQIPAEQGLPSSPQPRHASPENPTAEGPAQPPESQSESSQPEIPSTTVPATSGNGVPSPNQVPTSIIPPTTEPVLIPTDQPRPAQRFEIPIQTAPVDISTPNIFRPITSTAPVEIPLPPVSEAIIIPTPVNRAAPPFAARQTNALPIAPPLPEAEETNVYLVNIPVTAPVPVPEAPPPPPASIRFPLQVTREGIDGQGWDETLTESHHHDYPAGDIFAETGTPVVAPVAGTITRVSDHDRSKVGSRVQLHQDGDNTLWYMAHMADGIQVAEGQHVNPGDLIGHVGTDADAMNTPSHLHIDHLPADYDSRPICSGAGCRHYPWIDVQPALSSAFYALPSESPVAPPAPAGITISQPLSSSILRPVVASSVEAPVLAIPEDGEDDWAPTQPVLAHGNSAVARQTQTVAIAPPVLESDDEEVQEETPETTIPPVVEEALPVLVTPEAVSQWTGNWDHNLPSNQNIYNYYMSLPGATPQGVSGIVGNAMGESGGNSRRVQGNHPDSDYPVDDKGFGIFQWTFPSRQDNLVSFAESRGTIPGDPVSQLMFARQEMGDDLWTRVMQQPDAGSAAILFMNEYERPGIPHTEVRVQHANDSFEIFA